jgi:RHS repeat-associated protein
MLMPGRKYEAGSGYRYGFNGQEKNDEIKGEGNSYGAEYWEYDPRIGRRWNIDPKPTVSISNYNAFAGNPINFSDPLGDTLSLPGKYENTRTNSINDINSLVKNDNLKYISVNDNGQVTLKGAPQELKNARLKDAGFELLSNIIEAQEHFYYSVGYLTRVNSYDLNVPGSPPTQPDDGLDLTKYPVGSTISYDRTKINLYAADGRTVIGEVSDIQTTISNISKNLRGDEISYGNKQNTPGRKYTDANGKYQYYDGVVRIAPGDYYNMNGLTKVSVPRAAIVFHELYENYFRTHYGSTYKEAHAAAIQMERIFSHFTNYGDAPKYFQVK